MRPVTIVDTGPLVAYLGAEVSAQTWVTEQAVRLPPPWLTCEAVLTETAHLLRRGQGGPAPLLALLSRGLLAIPFQLESESRAVEALQTKYRNVPMSLTDACIVRMAEINRDCRVLTLDSDFLIYRRFGRQVVPTLMPGR